MAKKSMIAREKKRAQLAAKFAAKRTQLKETISSPRSSAEQVDAAVVELQKMPRDAGLTRGQRRCRVSGRPRAVYRKFGLCRNKLREAAMRGDVPGLVKASW
jgi:small subunit ribosomal protein S14